MVSVWKNRDFTWLFTGQTISQFGAAISNFAIPWLLLELTGSAVQMGFAFAVGFIPYLLVSLPAGVWADKYDRKKLMMIADIGRLLLLSSIPLFYFIFDIHIIQLYLVQAGISLFSALFDAAYGACLPNVVEKKQLQQANSVLQAGTSLSQIIGPALGGGLVGLFGVPETIIISGVSYLVSAVTLLKIKKHMKTENIAGADKQDMFMQIKEGLQYVWNNKLIRLTGIYATFLNFVIFASIVAIMYKVKEELGLDAAAAGIMTASFSLGSVIGSVINGKVNKYLSGKNLIVTILMLQIIPPLLIGFSDNVATIAVANGIGGVLLTIWNIQIITLRQSLIPDELMGRATTSIRLIAWCSIPLGNSIGGVLAGSYGTTSVFVIDSLVRFTLLAISIPLLFQGKRKRDYDFSLLENNRVQQGG
ncbi:MFS transporter [Bacillus sp. T33-2]|uniref:MFS transporter n=1 Tax=Bacillus sp. T33-2 TaxID=2054168 RepID=UPI000C775920|nr:MFS transporter [Bacillus sp. T33-2]PLR99218.1 hypothetical protein CVD19_02555 [Bacillus sp. T33-2]